MTERVYGCTFKLVMLYNRVHQSLARGTLAATPIQNDDLAIQGHSYIYMVIAIY